MLQQSLSEIARVVNEVFAREMPVRERMDQGFERCCCANAINFLQMGDWVRFFAQVR